MMLTEAFRIRDKKWAVQCALSRICGCCAMTLGRPIAFLGTPEEVARNAFHLPPMHVSCAQQLRAGPRGEPDWDLVTTAGFEVVRPDAHDKQLRFEPNSVL
ncbi:hypothetical protein [Nocardioides marmorisolisilvae]|uniref:Uncharacterized protein n=1 Tax=Nocardioides marmorisolisilvae TaxID=1542737 RepID=A0A3N0DS16_9ACTN|nr:hypothetical protein [Nocardioides marmorisolisilvae]RNL78276.1 hypothetical protein EFL95_03980 [Nocardioides marmorisolisilvae]